MEFQGNLSGVLLTFSPLLISVSSIQTVCNIREVKERLEGGKRQEKGGAEYVIVYAVITSLDLDRDEQSGVKVRW